MGRKQRYTTKEICDACEGTGGIKALVAQKLGCDRATVWRYAQRYKTVQRALEQADETLTDVAEAKTIQLIHSGYWPAIKYRLDTKGKDRGYTERQEVAGVKEQPIPIEIIKVREVVE